MENPHHISLQKIAVFSILALILTAGIAFAIKNLINNEVTPSEIISQSKIPTLSPTTIVTPEPTTPVSIDTSDWKTYTNTKYGFEIKYPGEAVDVKNDNEIEYSRESKIYIPDGFTKFMGYNPPRLATAIKVTNKTSSSSSYTFVPFNVWVFDNSKGISIDQWYMSYWYYPFHWGQAIESVVESNRPKYTRTVNNTEIKYAISDDMGPVEYGYAFQNGKMFLFVTRDKLGSQILSTFKFTKPVSGKIISQQEALDIVNSSLQSRCKLTFSEIKESEWTTGGPAIEILKEKICPDIDRYNEKKIWRANKLLDDYHDIVGFVGLDGQFVCVYALDKRAAPGIISAEKACSEGNNLNN